MSISEDQIFQLMLKMGKDSGPGDTEESVVGEQPDAYPDPSDEGQKADHTINASWGESPTQKGDTSDTAQSYSNAVLDEFVRGREEFLKRNFDSYGTSGDTNRKILGQSLEHAQKGNYDSSSAMYQDPADHTLSSKKFPAVADTLVDKTKKALDKY